MYFADHAPPHFHATYGETEGLISIESGQMLRGDLPNRAARLVREWAELHRLELQENWQFAQNGAKLKRIDPL